MKNIFASSSSSLEEINIESITLDLLKNKHYKNCIDVINKDCIEKLESIFITLSFEDLLDNNNLFCNIDYFSDNWCCSSKFLENLYNTINCQNICANINNIKFKQLIYNICFNKHTPKHILINIFNKFNDHNLILKYLAFNNNSPSDVLRSIFELHWERSNHIAIIINLAENLQTPADVLEQIFYLSNSNYHKFLYLNKNLPIHLKEKLDLINLLT